MIVRGGHRRTATHPVSVPWPAELEPRSFELMQGDGWGWMGVGGDGWGWVVMG